MKIQEKDTTGVKSGLIQIELQIVLNLGNSEVSWCETKFLDFPKISQSVFFFPPRKCKVFQLESEFENMLNQNISKVLLDISKI